MIAQNSLMQAGLIAKSLGWSRKGYEIEFGKLRLAVIPSCCRHRKIHSAKFNLPVPNCRSGKAIRQICTRA
ncbi:MAG: hypothetical protein WBA29_15175 [Xanthobacteraceae bacterium]